MDNETLLAHAASGFACGFILVFAAKQNRGLVRIGAVLAALGVVYVAIAQGVPGVVDQAGALLAYFEEYAIFFRGAAAGQMAAMMMPGAVRKAEQQFGIQRRPRPGKGRRRQKRRSRQNRNRSRRRQTRSRGGGRSRRA